MQGVREYSACSTAHFDEPQSQLFKKLGIEDQVKEKAHMIERPPMASEVAKGKYAVGFQQVSELLRSHNLDSVAHAGTFLLTCYVAITKNKECIT